MSRIIAASLRTIASFFAADGGDHAVVLDAVAGGEFLDDRIRSQE